MQSSQITCTNSCSMNAVFIFLGAALFVFSVSPVHSALIMYDEQQFLSLYGGPVETIDFSVLKDGTTYDEVQGVHPLLTNQAYPGDSWGEYIVREYAWNDDHLIRTTNCCGGFWAAMRWNGDSVGNQHHPTTNVSLSIVQLNEIGPIALDVQSTSYSGFVALIPETDADYHLLLNLPALRVHEMRYGYKPISVPEPPTVFLILGSLFGLVFLRAFPRLSSLPPFSKYVCGR